MQPKSINLSTRPDKQRNTSSVEVSLLLHVHSWIVIIFFKDNVNEWLLLLATGRALLMNPKGRKHSGMISSKLVGWYTHYCFLAYSFQYIVNAPYAYMLLCQLGARFTISISSPIIFKSIVFFILFTIFILHSRESDVSLCFRRQDRTLLGVAIFGSPVFHIKVKRPVKCLAQGHNKRTCWLAT